MARRLVFEAQPLPGVLSSCLGYTHLGIRAPATEGAEEIMATPLDAVTAIHNAFRRDIASIDRAALTARIPELSL